MSDFMLNRRNFLKAGVSAAAFMGASSASSAALPKPQKPNIVFIMSDQHRGDCVGAAGNKAIHTPHLDRLAREGALFSNAYSTTPTCTPARTALMTGLGPWRNGMLGYGRIGEGYPIEMPSAMRDAGYYAFGLGKMHWHPQRNLHGFHRLVLDESGREMSVDFRSDYRSWLMSIDPNVNPDITGLSWNDHRAWPYKLPEEWHPTRWTGETAANFIDTYDRTEPFFMKVSFARPHSPYDPPQRLWDQYGDVDLPKAAIGDWAGRYAARSDDSNELWHGDLGADQVRTSRRGYYGSVSFVDEEVGRIIDALEYKGILENTLILYTSDHGDMTGDHHLWRKSYAYEASANIPMIIRWPKGTLSDNRGQIRPEPVEIRDILPTFMDAAGASGAETLDGASMLSLVQNNRARWREHIDLEHDICYAPSNHWSGVTDGRYKFVFHAQTGEEQFFDLEDDPQELVDLAAKGAKASRQKEFRDRLIEHLLPRGEEFVSGGKLALRPERHLYSPNYPGCKCHGISA